MNNSNIWQLQNAKNKLSELINIASKNTYGAQYEHILMLHNGKYLRPCEYFIIK